MDMPEQPTSELALSRVVDAELVRLAREGSVSALRLIVRRHNQRLYRVARAIVRDDTEAEDVMQEAYLSAFRHLATFRADASLATWLTRIVVNKAIGHLRPERIMVPLEPSTKSRWPDAGRCHAASRVRGRSRTAPPPAAKFATCWNARSTTCLSLSVSCS